MLLSFTLPLKKEVCRAVLEDNIAMGTSKSTIQHYAPSPAEGSFGSTLTNHGVLSKPGTTVP